VRFTILYLVKVDGPWSRLTGMLLTAVYLGKPCEFCERPEQHAHHGSWSQWMFLMSGMSAASDDSKIIGTTQRSPAGIDCDPSFR
jgi:hypothetical protein